MAKSSQLALQHAVMAGAPAWTVAQNAPSGEGSTSRPLLTQYCHGESVKPAHNDINCMTALIYRRQNLLSTAFSSDCMLLPGSRLDLNQHAVWQVCVSEMQRHQQIWRSRSLKVSSGVVPAPESITQSMIRACLQAKQGSNNGGHHLQKRSLDKSCEFKKCMTML